MTEKAKQIVMTALFAALIFTLSAVCLFSPPKEYSLSERRSLAQPPEFTANAVFSGQFASEFEVFAQDQFPLRETFRSMKSASALYLFSQKTVNNLYLADGHISKAEPDLKENMIEHAIERFSYLQETYFPEKTPIFAVIPDKNFYLAEKHGYLTFDHNALVEMLKKSLPKFEVTDLSEVLELSDYYFTDTHWKQECITDAAESIAEKFGKTLPDTYTPIPMHVPFYGVYYGQLALPVKPDVISYLQNPILEGMRVTTLDSGKAEEILLYDTAKGEGKDGYELYLGGAHAVVQIENPKGEGELVVFSDSFGQSMAPLLAQGYAKTTVVDIRYIQSGMVGNFVAFENADILFLYSTMMLNQGNILK